MDHKIGIIGLGYVGNAVKAAFSKNYNIYSFDINQNCSEKTLKAVVEKSDIIFICVPTPMQEDGSCHTEILFQVITDINNCDSNFGKGTGADPPTCKANEVALPLKPLDISSMIL